MKYALAPFFLLVSFFFPNSALCQNSLCDKDFSFEQGSPAQIIGSDIYLVDPWDKNNPSYFELGTFYVNPVIAHCQQDCVLRKAGYLFNRTPIRLMLNSGNIIRMYNERDGKFYYKFISVSGLVGYVRCDKIRKYKTNISNDKLKNQMIVFPLEENVKIYKEDGAGEPHEELLTLSYEDKRIVLADGTDVVEKQNESGMPVKFVKVCFDKNGIQCGLIKHRAKDYILLSLSKNDYRPVAQEDVGNYFEDFDIHASLNKNINNVLEELQSCKGEKKLPFKIGGGLKITLPFFDFGVTAGMEITYTAPEGFVYEKLKYKGDWGTCSVYYKIKCWGNYAILGADSITVTCGKDTNLYLFSRDALEEKCRNGCSKLSSTSKYNGKTTRYMVSLKKDASLKEGSSPYLLYTGFLKTVLDTLYTDVDEFSTSAFGQGKVLVNQLVRAEPAPGSN
jgi:hypothetical protein